MKALLALMIPAPLLAAFTPTELLAAIVAACVVGYVCHELFAEHFRQKKIRRDVQRFFERRARNQHSIRL